MTSATLPMIESYPQAINVDHRKLAETIDALLTCSEACTACADACLSEIMVAELTTCIRRNMDCADICSTTARVLSRHTGNDVTVSRMLLEACALACRSCAVECGTHAQEHEHCRICAEACQICELACRDLLAVLA